MEGLNIVVAIIGGIVTIISSVAGSWIAVRVLLATHDEKIDRIEKDIEEIKDERKAMHMDLKEITILMNKIYAKVGVLDERTKKS